MNEPEPLEGIAIVGLAGRFPGAQNVAEFWRNLLDGKETITRATAEELAAAGLDADLLMRDPAYVPARGRIDRPEWFDASFFGINPKEAEVMDPQQRVFLEEAWNALEDAGCDPARFQGAIGVYAGMSNNSYWRNNVASRPDLIEAVGDLTAMMGNEKDYLATRVAYKLNLRGPALNIYTACSTSLVAVCQAVTGLLNFHCDLALVGGISITFPQERGYHFQEGGITSPDGHCRPFDAQAAGTVFSSGVGVVALKRLADAVASGDQIYAVIKGAALNNDGSQKVSFTAPSVDGHTEVIALAQALAGFSPETISYVEAHGTGTPLGDPIEIAGLTQAFQSGTDQKRFCAIGSVKSNIGHLDAAAGIAGLIKTALALKHRVLPASLHFTAPNPKLELEDSPFFVNAKTREWTGGPTPRRAGVSSFGVGGTNAHVVLEEAPPREQGCPTNNPQLLVLSAKTATALDAARTQLAEALKERQIPLADVAWTLQTGRHFFNHRSYVVASSDSEAVEFLTSESKRPKKQHTEHRHAPVAFLFPGQGAQYAGMGAGLYEAEPVFRKVVDECAELLRDELQMDIRDLLLRKEDDSKEQLRQTHFTQPAIFVISYALAQLWKSWGVQPQILLGHSVGEFVAACVAGVFSLPDALRLVATRARLVQEQPPGAMLAVRLSEAELAPLLEPPVGIAALNAPSLSVAAGPIDAIEALETKLRDRGTAARRLTTSHAFHSAMMDPVVDQFRECVRRISLQTPHHRLLSSVTGEWLTDDQATDPNYWAAHLRQPVRFTNAVATLLKEDGLVLLEVGPGQTLTQLVRQHRVATPQSAAVSLHDEADDRVTILNALGSIWLAGVEPDWSAIHCGESRHRVSLPTYPFERQRFWAEPTQRAGAEVSRPTVIAAIPKLSQLAGDDQEKKSAVAEPVSRVEQLLAQIQRELEALSGLSLAGADPHRTFIELGLDSLFLTQASLVLQKRFGIPISFRRMLEHSPSPAALAEWLDAKLPAAEAPPSVSADGYAVQAHDSRRESRPQANAGTKPPAAFGPYRAIDRTSAASDFTPAQQEHFRDLVTRYTKKTAGSKSATERHRSYLADPRAIAGFRRAWKEITYPLVTDRSEGAKLWDVDGNEYIDITLGFGQILFGHRPEFLTRAIEEQLNRGFEIGPTSPLAGEVAALIRDLTGMPRVAFCNTGSEAVVAAIRTARTVTGRDKIALFAGGYHGIVDEVLVRAGGAVSDGVAVPVPIAPGIPASAVENVLVLNYGDPEALEIIRQHGHELAAVLVEPVQSRRPELQPREFLHDLRQIATECGAALVFDEVVTGFRCHIGGAQAHFSVRADIATYGKIVGGGLPIGIVAGEARFMDALDGGAWNFGDDSVPEVGMTFFAGTFVRHPLVLAAARAILKRLKESSPALQQTLDSRTTALVNELNAYLELREIPLRWNQFSSLYHLQIPPEFKHAGLLFHHLRLRGIHAWEGRPCFLSEAHTPQDLERVVQAFKESVGELCTAGFLNTGHPLASDGTFPLTEAQKELFLASQMGEEASASFNDSVSILFTGAVDTAALESALNGLADRHEALRTIFDRNGNWQRALPNLHVTLPVKDLTALSSEARQDEAKRRIEAHTCEPFDLTQGPLIRAELLQLAEDRSQLIVTVHHIVCDGWSFGILASELPLLYRAARGDVIPLPEAFPFRAYSRWIDDRVADGTCGTAETYWLQQFTTVPPALELPVDLPRTTQRSYRADRRSVVIPEILLVAARRLSASRQTTLFTTLLAVFQTLLSRLSGQTDLVTGIASAGQAVMGQDRLVGHCVNFLPLRAIFRDGCSFLEHLESTRASVLDAQEHQHFTFGTLIQKLALPRDEGRMPLVSVAFNMDRSTPSLNFGDVAGEFDINPKSRLGLELSFNILETATGTQLYCAFNRSLFRGDTIERWLQHYLTLLNSALKAPATRVDRLPLLTAEQREHLVRSWNQTGRPLPSPATLPELFEQWVEKIPDAVAVISGATVVSYAHLDRRANAVARRLCDNGLAAGTLVGFRAERSERFVIAVLGVLKAGGVYVPLDESLPSQRLEQLRKHCGALIDLDADLAGECDSSPGRQRSPEDAAYVLYTSGTTGEPKGVAVPHQGVVRLVCNTDYVQMCADDIVALASHPCFDAITFELWGALLNGGRLVVTPTDVLLSPTALEEHMGRHRITTLFLTTSLFNQLSRQAPGMFRTLRHLVFGGEAADANTVRLVLENGRPGKLVNGYGPTETTTFAVCHTIESVTGSRVPIGKPIANTEVYLLDRHFEPVPIGVTGELYIGGPGVSLGYINASELTAEKFVETPFGRLYRSGDLARWMPDGIIEYLGRTDHQIKLRGFRIEPAEIESAMQRIPGIARCAVVVRDISAGDRRLVAYYTAKVTPAPSVAALKGALTKTLPAFMIPNAFVEISEFPLTPNGKLATDQLPLPAAESAVQASYVAPRNALHSQMIEIWEELLGRHPIGIRDNFFVLGGHSLLAARMLATVEKRFGKRPPFAALFQDPTIEHIAGILLADQQQMASEQPYVAIHEHGTERPFFFLHGDYVGGGFFCRTLARELGEDRPFYALHPHGLTGDRPQSIAAMAAERLAAIRKIQPEGPYLLGGYCNGALTAFEIARQLEEQGETVAALLMLTADGASYRVRHLEMLADIFGRVAGESLEERRQRFLRWHHKMRLTEALMKHYVPAGRDLLRRPWREQARVVQRLAQRVRGHFRKAAPAHTAAAMSAEPAKPGTSKLSAAFQDAMLGFVPHSFGGRATLLWPEEDPAPQGDPAYGWSQVCEEVEVLLVPGSHHSCVAQTRHLEIIGGKMRDLLDSVEAGRPRQLVPVAQ